MNMQTIALIFMVTIAVGGVAWVFIYPFLSGERQADKRLGNIARAETNNRVNKRQQQSKSRREQVEETLKDIEVRAKKPKNVPLTTKISQAGLSWSKQQYFLIAAGLGLSIFVVLFLLQAGLIVALAGGFAGAFGAPLWILSFLKKRREARFLDGFPDAVDVIVRGIKSGLPLLDNLKVIANEAQEPIKTEFRAIVDTQTIGMPLGEACGKLYERIPLAEANFFGIVISIQQKSGGNLSEALGNLSRVLRDRKQMKAKVKAMSTEAKASAGIIGSLPLVVGALVYLASPGYVDLLWTTDTGRLLMMGGGLWMSMGIFVMRQMINFDF